MTSWTRPPLASVRPAFGRWEMTVPALRRERAFFTLPTLHPAPAYLIVKGMTVALQKGEAAKAEKEGKRANAQQIRAMRHMAACIESIR